MSDRGFLVGLDPAIVFNGTQAFVAYRDGHNGQFAQQDWDGSDLEVAMGGAGQLDGAAWWPRAATTSRRTAATSHGDGQRAAGAGARPGVRQRGRPGHNVLFQRRKADGTWTAPLQVQTVSNTQRGASLAWDPRSGYGVAVVDRTSNKLTYHLCRGTACTVVGLAAGPGVPVGRGGWYPSLAFDPETHEPSIAFYICSLARAPTRAAAAREDELRVAALIEGNWQERAGGRRGRLVAEAGVPVHRPAGGGVPRAGQGRAEARGGAMRAVARCWRRWGCRGCWRGRGCWVAG